MKIFAIGDLHLPGGDLKPMDVFGEHWKNHFEKISRDWCSRVAEDDWVLIPGDISWALQLREALPDLRRIGMLPGNIVLLRGNHDYWWTSLTQLRTALPERMHVVQNDALDAGSFVIAGTRGWTIPQAGSSAQDVKIFKREVLRLSMSLQEAGRIAEGRPIVAMMHYPPVPIEWMKTGTEFTKLLSDSGVSNCVYGHLHGQSIAYGFNGIFDSVRYDLVSCDALNFTLKEIILNR